MTHIAIDLTPIQPGGSNGGAKLLTIDLIRHFATLAPQHQFTLLTLKDSHDELVVLDAANINRVCLDRTAIKPLSESKFDLLFCPFPNGFSVGASVPIVSVIHDIQFRYYPHFFETKELQNREMNFKKICRTSQKIICISDFVKDTILHNSNLTPEMIETIYINLPNRLLNKKNSCRDDNFLLYPANFWQHKNHHTLFSAFKIYRDNHPTSTLKLICTGDQLDKYEIIQSHIHALGLEEWIIWPGYVSDSELSALMYTCTALIFPSVYEGFGMPVVEAMMIGKPVLCSNVTSLPEIAGDAALFFDPNLPEEIALAISKITTDTDLRQDLIKRGYRRSEFFADEQKMAQEYLDVFEDVINQHKEFQSVCVVTPSYNQGKFIERTIQSVLNQHIPMLDYVVFDGGSTDNTIEILKKYQDKICWTSEKDKGQTHAINKGINATIGEIVGWLNSDDVYYPDALNKVLHYFKQNPDIEIVYGLANYIDENDHIIEPYPIEEWNFERLILSCFICQPAVFFRRSVFEKYGLLDEALHYCMDYEYWLRLGKAGVKFGFINDVLAASRLHPDTKTLSARPKIYLEVTSMLKRTLGRTPDRTLINYAHSVVDPKNFIKHGSNTYIFSISLISCYAAIRWNKRISKSMMREFIKVSVTLSKRFILNKLPIVATIYKKLLS